MAEPWVGIIANPVSARDIRRVIANAASLQITDRANIVLRVLACLKACGIQRVMMMPEAGGIRGHVKRGLDRSANRGEMEFPELSFVDMRVTGTVEDSRRAAAAMCAAGRFGHRRAGRRRHPSRRGLGLREGAARRHLHRHQQRLSRASRAHGHGARRRPRRRRAHPGLGRLPAQQALRRLRQ